MIVAITIPFRVAFENKPRWYSVLMESYLNLVFLIDFIRHLLSPPNLKRNAANRQSYYTRKQIAILYMWPYGLMDLYSMFPLAVIRYNNVWADGGFDIWTNLKTLNFDRLPRLYKVLLLGHLLRAR